MVDSPEGLRLALAVGAHHPGQAKRIFIKGLLRVARQGRLALLAGRLGNPRGVLGAQDLLQNGLEHLGLERRLVPNPEALVQGIERLEHAALVAAVNLVESREVSHNGQGHGREVGRRVLLDWDVERPRPKAAVLVNPHILV